MTEQQEELREGVCPHFTRELQKTTKPAINGQNGRQRK